MYVKGYAIYDEKAGLFSMPFFLQNDITAIRTMRSTYTDDRESTVGRYPSEFSLFCIGEFDDNTGLLGSPLPPRNMGLIRTLIAKSEEL